MERLIQVEIEVVDNEHCDSMCDFFGVVGEEKKTATYFCKLDMAIFHCKDSIGFKRTKWCKDCEVKK